MLVGFIRATDAKLNTLPPLAGGSLGGKILNPGGDASYHPPVTESGSNWPLSEEVFGDSPSTRAEPIVIRRQHDHPLLLWSILALVSLAMLLYAITVGFVWDEGFHLLAAQLINKGRLPYLDFCFPQTPLNAYWNAAWMRLTGLGWKITHVTATLACVGSALLVTDYIFRRQTGRWRFTAALTTGLAVICNQTLWKFGTCAQAYGLGTFLTVCAFRAALPSIRQAGVWLPVLAGLFAGAAASSTLLTAPAAPVILIWILIYSYNGNRWRKAIGFVIGAAVPFFPVGILWVRGPGQTFFNVVQYQAIFRRVDWPGAGAHDFEVLTAWMSDSAMFVISLLAVVAVVSVRRWSGTSVNRRAEVYLCASLAAALTLYIATAHPTFERYFVFAIPFLAALAGIGLVLFAARLGLAVRPGWTAVLTGAFLLLSLGRDVFVDRDAITWNNYVRMTDRIRQVTPAKGEIFADEQVYFLMDRTPPSGMEFSYARKLDLPADQARLYHIVSTREWTKQVQGGRFATVETCKDDVIDKMRLPELFPHQQDFEDCTVFWGNLRPLKPAENKSGR